MYIAFIIFLKKNRIVIGALAHSTSRTQKDFDARTDFFLIFSKGFIRTDGNPFETPTPDTKIYLGRELSQFSSWVADAHSAHS